MIAKLIGTLSILCITTSLWGMELGRARLPAKNMQLLVSVIADDKPMPQDGASQVSAKKQPVPPPFEVGQESANKLVVNRLSTLLVEAKSLGSPPRLQGPIELLAFDARMPAHNHGMIVSPRITKLDDYHWKVEGFKLHMKGLWQFVLTVKVQGQEELVGFDMSL